MSNVKLTNLQKATALLSVATVTIGVAGDKLAAEQVPGTGPILERITEVLNDLGAISDWLTECLLGTNAHAGAAQSVCNNCGTAVGDLALAGVAIEMDGLTFCCAGCLEEWADAVRNKQEDKAQP